MASVGRNEPCTCGSGRKYKHCCERKRSERADLRDSLAKSFFYLIGPLAIIIIGALIASSYFGQEDKPGPNTVWSTAHGHWHVVNADGSEGELRPGTVWSEEHGHWHPGEAVSDGLPTHFRIDAERDLERAEGSGPR